MTATRSGQNPGDSGTRDLYWFESDLRLEDNPGLLQHAGGDALLSL